MSTGELKIVITGPMGAGKTTAIRAISDSPPVSTEVGNHDKQTSAKDSTTVALDYGEVALEMTSPSSQGVFRPVGESGYVHVVMPMFVQW